MSDDVPEQFAAWFRKNYPGPDTIIHKPDWHAPKIYRAALAAMPADDTLTLLRAREADLAQANETVARLRALLRDVIDGWDWWNKDQYDRCQSVPNDAIEAARAALEADNG